MGAPRVFLSRSSPQSSFLPPKGSHTPNPVLWGRRWGEPWGEVSLPCLVTPPDPPTPLHPPHSILTPTLTASWTSKHPLNTQRGGGGSNPSPLQLRGDPKDAGLALSPPPTNPHPYLRSWGAAAAPRAAVGQGRKAAGKQGCVPSPRAMGTAACPARADRGASPYGHAGAGCGASCARSLSHIGHKKRVSHPCG